MFVVSGVTVTLEPARVKLSVFEPALIVVFPTVTLLNAFWLTSAPAAIPSNFVLSSVVKDAVIASRIALLLCV